MKLWQRILVYVYISQNIFRDFSLKGTTNKMFQKQQWILNLWDIWNLEVILKLSNSNSLNFIKNKLAML